MFICPYILKNKNTKNFIYYPSLNPSPTKGLYPTPNPSPQREGLFSPSLVGEGAGGWGNMKLRFTNLEFRIKGRM